MKYLFSLFFALSAWVSLAQSVTGRVYLAGETGERPVEGVTVSDGYSVVSTDARGQFRIDPAANSKFIFITTPSGTVPATPFYVRREEGALYEFGLTQQQTFSRFVHMSDTEATIYKDWVDDLKAFVRHNPVDFMVLNGDICYEKGLRFHRDNLTDQTMGTRMVYTVGNHDLLRNYGNYAEEFFEDSFGPAWYSFDVNGVHFVTLPVTYGDKEPRYKYDDILRWLRSDLQALPASYPVVVLCHFLLGYNDDFVLSSAGEVLDLMQYNLKGWLYGHWHNNLFEQGATGVKTFSTMSPNKGGIDHSPSSFRVVDFDESGNLESRLIYSKVRKHLAGYAFSDGDRIKIVASAYDCTVAVEEVLLTVRENNGEDTVYPLGRESHWTWTGLLPLADSLKPLSLQVRFSGGDRMTALLPYERRVGWATNLGAPVLMTSPVVAAGRLFTATADDEKGRSCGVVALDQHSGEVLWFAPTRNSVKNNIAVSGEVVLACDAEAIVYGLDAATGRLLWQTALEKAGLQPYYSQGITVSDGVVYAGQGVSLAALDVQTGNFIWKNTAWKGGVVSAPTPVVTDGAVLASAYWTGRFAHDARTGELLWEKRDDLTRNCDGSPVEYDGKWWYTSPSHIFEIDPRTGEELRRIKTDFVHHSVSRPLLTDSLLIMGTTDKGLIALDRTRDYKLAWNFKTNPVLFYTAPYTKDFQQTVESGAALYGDCVYFGAGDGFLYCLEARTGTFQWRMNVGSPVLSNIVIDQGHLYFNDFAGNVVQIKL